MSPTRDKSTARQTAASVLILLILAGIVAVILLNHARAVNGTPAAAEKVEAIFPSLPDGITPAGDIERFDADNLYEKIDGKADLYLASGFRELRCRRFQAAGGQIEAFVYDMGEAKNAMAVYLAQKRKNVREMDLPDASYLTANALYLMRGSYYVELVADAAGDEMTKAMTALAKKFIEATAASGETFDEKQLFPPDGLDRENITLIAKEAFGFAKLDSVMTAGYRVDGAGAVAYVSRRGSEAEAASLVNEYADFLEGEWFEKASPTPGVPNCRAVELDGSYEIIFSVGRVLAGVRECENRAAADRLVKMLRQRIEEVNR